MALLVGAPGAHAVIGGVFRRGISRRLRRFSGPVSRRTWGIRFQGSRLRQCPTGGCIRGHAPLARGIGIRLSRCLYLLIKALGPATLHRPARDRQRIKPGCANNPGAVGGAYTPLGGAFARPACLQKVETGGLAARVRAETLLPLPPYIPRGTARG